MQKEKSSEWPLIDAFGICRQTLLPLYLRPTFDSALVTQLLFGECYQTIAMTSDQQWFKIFHEGTGLQGWITTQSLKEIPAGDYYKYLNTDFQIVTSPVAAIEYQSTNLYLLPGSRLHFSDLELFNWQDHIGFTGSVRSHVVKADRAQLIDIASKFVNSPFQSGGRSLFGMDEIQGFELIFNIAGYSWKSGDILGRKIDSELILPGDLFIFKELERKHVKYALYLGAEEVLWMDNRLRVSYLSEWETIIWNSKDNHAELETRSIIN
ncbi:hypothetical protein LV84_03182 [Algoriphagus ratkowskyi]|uniref:Bacterial dipeptidyl-peptidase SH3 domain-containing protein n=1 Tax=Algoriphagus ratkowskyi TaxID=57028 RepID=A0A2W7QY72_9BACT|nr:hypothetical protein [Algoriphagus ratkowskyi]PZX53458.1 hypothetical protein LV84_03182 [Algoriphagus ratkowskyi]TXD76505.1 hypothetical protein ESW18_15985 [Algoriphagus ratkowskyi]